MTDVLVHLLGWRATMLHGDAAVYDRWRWLKRRLTPGPVRTLDAGCGSGAFSLFAAKAGNRVTGLSFDTANQAKAMQRAAVARVHDIQFLTGDLRELETFGETLGTFDQIICLETIEHIWNDAKLVSDLAKRLKPGGRLILTTPYKGYHPLLGDHVSPTEDGGHVRYGYTHEEIRTLFHAAGLDVVEEDFISGWVTQRLINVWRRLGRVSAPLAWAVTLPLRLLQVVDRPVTSLTHYPYLSIGVVGVRRA